MDQSLHTPKPYDYRQYDRIWQRVAPELEPYPGWKEQAVPALADLTPSGGTSGSLGDAGTAAQGADAAPEAASRTEASQEAQPSAGLTLAEEAQLPSAQENPCCMGTAASEMLAVIQGFIDAELLDQRYDQALARQAPSWARGRMRELAAAAGARARRLMAVYYLITGSCYQPVVESGRIWMQHWCPALRERYHAAACGAMNYLRAADGTTDPCLSRLLTELGEDEYRRADQLLALLERGMRQG